ncbi:hypothetical protein BG618_02808 [Pseudonocardia autotrophica]|nr:hypothetical protein BG618_02808 [Pseudonocardia autotrophica]
MTPALTDLLVATALGGALVALGLWARRGVALTPRALPEPERLRRGRAIRRGGWACLVVGAVLVAAGSTLFVITALRG